MSKTLLQRLATGLLPFLLAACAATGSAQLSGVEERGARLAKAEAMFAERCKKAGVFIHRTAENVEGVFLMKLRPQGINHGDQYRMDDPYGRDFGGDAYIRSFLNGFFEANYKRPDEPRSNVLPHIAYSYVEALDPKDGQRYRYTGSRKVVGRMDASAPNVKVDLARDPNFDLNIYAFTLDKVPAPGPMPRYGVTYEDISTREERDYWIAGSSLKVIDLQTNEVMAERIGYMMDRGQGNTNSGRSPWLFAADHACPTFQRNPNFPLQPGHGASAQRHQTEDFVERILKPVLEK